MNGYYSKQPRFWRGLSIVVGLTGVLLWPSSVTAQDATRDFAQRGVSAKQRSDRRENAERSVGSENKPESRLDQPLSWARIDFILNQVDLVPQRARARRARISDVLGIGDALRTFESSNAELRFNDGSEVRIGSRATFRFTPNTRNFELTNGTVLLLIPPERGRTTIQTPNAVTGIQGSALFVRYIEETDTTIVGALTDNPDGPMILYTNNGAEEQALYANQVGVVEGDRITELYEIDSRAFWESSGLAETFDYTEDVGSVVDELDGVRQEIRDAIENQDPIDGSNVVENPDNFSRPQTDDQPQVTNPTDGPAEEPSEPTPSEGESEGSSTEGGGDAAVDNPDLILGGEETEESEGQVIQYEGSPAEEFHNQNGRPAGSVNGGGNNALQPAPLTEAESEDEAASAGNSTRPNSNAGQSGTNTNSASEKPSVNGSNRPPSDRPVIRPESNSPVAPTTPPAGGTIINNPVLPGLPDNDPTEIVAPPTVGAGQNPRPTIPTAQPNVPTGGVAPLPSGALQDAEPDAGSDSEDETESEGNDSNPTGSTADPADGGGAVVPGASGAGGSGNADGPAEGPPVIEETDATLNNPDEAEAVELPTVTEEAVEEEIPVIAEPDAAPSNSDGAVDPSPVLEEELEEAAPIIEETDATLNNPDEAEAVEIPTPVETDTVDELPEAPDAVTELENPVISPSGPVESEAPEAEGAVEVEAPAAEAEVVEIETPAVEVEVETPTAEVEVEAPTVEAEVVEIETPAVEAPAVEAVEAVPDVPEVFEDEIIVEPQGFETPTNELEELPPETISGGGAPDNFSAEDAPLIEALEDPIPAQLEETVPFAVEQVDDLSAEQGLLGEGNGQIDNVDNSNGANGAALSDTPSGQPGLQ